jgi:hypothetical protein
MKGGALGGDHKGPSWTGQSLIKGCVSPLADPLWKRLWEADALLI